MTKLAVIFLIAYAAQWFFHDTAQVGVWWIAMILAVLGLNKSLELKRQDAMTNHREKE